MLEESLEEKKNRKERREELESVSLPTDIYMLASNVGSRPISDPPRSI